LKRYLSFLFLLLFPVMLHAQYVWTQKATFGGSGRHRATGFAIGNRGYMGLGHINSTGDIQYKDWWEYDPGSNSWTQKANFGGGKRYHATGFAIGNKGYVGTGRDSALNSRNDWWEYDPVMNTWSQKTSLPAQPRRGAVSFAIGSKGYLGTGSYYQDFWEYDPSTNSWSQKASFPASGRTSAVGFGIAGKGYIGTGDIGGSTNDFWCYDPMSNTWTAKANVPGPTRMEAAGFSMNGKGYIGTGDDYSSGNNYSDFYCYDPGSNSWTQIADFGGTARRYLTCFSIGNRGYGGLGTSGTNMQDFWEYGNLSAVEELDGNPYNISIYPNPLSEKATISIGKTLRGDEEMKLLLYDVSGRMVRTVSIVSNSMLMQRDGLSAGAYFYRVDGKIEGKSMSVASGTIVIK
jgi:N-acetylneuraminic acid mutarotase